MLRTVSKNKKYSDTPWLVLPKRSEFLCFVSKGCSNVIFEKQIKLQNFVLTLPDDHEWNVDFGTGKFKLHNQTFDVMLAGSESFISNT